MTDELVEINREIRLTWMNIRQATDHLLDLGVAADVAANEMRRLADLLEGLEDVDGSAA